MILKRAGADAPALVVYKTHFVKMEKYGKMWCKGNAIVLFTI